MSTQHSKTFREPRCRRSAAGKDLRRRKWTDVVIALLLLGLVAALGLWAGGDPGFRELLIRYLWHPLLTLLKWVGWFLGLFLLWTFFFAQFLLPLERIGDRLAMTWRVVAHAVGWAGPILMVQDGRILSSQDEILCKGPGLVVTDLASAVVLRTKLNYSRVVPPSSVAFLRPGIPRLCESEYVEDVVDLRSITRVVGPHADDQPFAPRKLEEDERRYQERLARFYRTRGLTRDGVEVVARIWVKFHLRDDEERCQTFPCAEERWRLWFDPDRRAFPPFCTIYHGTARAVWRAVLARPLQTDTPESNEENSKEAGYRRYPWDWLPAMMAVELWREYVRRFTLDELFTPLKKCDAQTGMEVIQRAMEARLTQERYQELDLSGHLNRAGQRASPEFRELERRGISVDKVIIIGLFLPPEVEKGLAQLRVNAWLQRAQVEREKVERQRALAHEEGERAALAFLGRSLQHFRPALQKTAKELLKEQEAEGKVALDGFFLGVANTVMASLANEFDRSDLRERLGAREVGRLRKLLARLRRFRLFS